MKYVFNPDVHFHLSDAEIEDQAQCDAEAALDRNLAQRIAELENERDDYEAGRRLLWPLAHAEELRDLYILRGQIA